MGTVCEDIHTFMKISCRILRMRYVADKSSRENHNTHFLFLRLFIPVVF